MSEIHTQLIFNSEMSMRASLIRLILSVRVHGIIDSAAG